MATRRERSWWQRIGKNAAHALAWLVTGSGGQAGVLVAKTMSERPPDRDIYDPAPRQPSHRRMGRRRAPARREEANVD